MATPKLPQANGTHVPCSPEGQRSPSDSDRERSPCPHHAHRVPRGPALGLAPCRGCSTQPSHPRGSPGSPEEHLAAFSPGPIDSPNSSMENPLDTTGDITVEEVKDFLA